MGQPMRLSWGRGKREIPSLFSAKAEAHWLTACSLAPAHTIITSRIQKIFSLWGKYLGNWFPIREANSGLPNCFYIDLHS